MKLRTLLIDDEPIALDKLTSYAEKIPFLEIVGKFSGGYEAIDFIAGHDVDLIFTDINMPDISGIEFVESLSSNPMVVFTTAYSEYAIEGYRLCALDYLLKPYRFADFSRVAQKALNNALMHKNSDPSQSKSKSIFIKVENKFVRVSLDDIRYIKGYGEYLQIYISGRSHPLLTISNFASILDKLSPNFLQVHRSYVVNMDMISQVERNRIIIDPDVIIPVSDTYKTPFLDYISSRSVGRQQKN